MAPPSKQAGSVRSDEGLDLSGSGMMGIIPLPTPTSEGGMDWISNANPLKVEEEDAAGATKEVTPTPAAGARDRAGSASTDGQAGPSKSKRLRRMAPRGMSLGGAGDGKPGSIADDETVSSRAESPASSVEGTKAPRRKQPARLSMPASSRPTRSNTPLSTTNVSNNPSPASVPPLAVIPPGLVTPTKNSQPPALQPYYSSPHSVFRPPPSAALEIFTRPPVQDFQLSLQAANPASSIPSSSALTPLESLESATLPYQHGNGPDPSPSTALPSSTGLFGSAHPLSSVSGGSQSSVAVVSPEAGPSQPKAPTQPPMTPSRAGQLGPSRGNTASPYVVKKSAKSGGRKAKEKANAAIVEDGILNNDYCSSCRGIGRFLCCDGCPRSFHFMCLEPPLKLDEMPAEDEWFCKECRVTRRPKNFRPTAVKGIFAPLLDQIEAENPVQFKLPDDIRGFFANVTTASDGSYEQAVDMKPIKFDRAGFPEGRDVYRLRNKGKAVLCYQCKGSAAPVPGQGTSQGRKILSCDYCPLSWHLDCLSPPTTNLPNPQRKWMCPNHAQHVAPKRRALRHGVEEIFISQAGFRNNGNVEIVDDEAERKRIEYETQYINGKRYKIPEKVIQLDFWSKIGKGKLPLAPVPKHAVDPIFGGQSPLSTAPSSPSYSEKTSLARSSVAPRSEMESYEQTPDLWAVDALMGLHSLGDSSQPYRTIKLKLPTVNGHRQLPNGLASSKPMAQSLSDQDGAPSSRLTTPPPLSGMSEPGVMDLSPRSARSTRSTPSRITLRFPRQALMSASSAASAASDTSPPAPPQPPLPLSDSARPPPTLTNGDPSPGPSANGNEPSSSSSSSRRATRSSALMDSMLDGVRVS